MRAISFLTLLAALLLTAAFPEVVLSQVQSAAAKQPVRFSGRFVVLDAGHGGAVAPGTSSSQWPDGLSESQVTYALTSRVARLLEARGVSVRTTRRHVSDNPSLATRAAHCTADCALFVSIHFNAMPVDPHPSYGLEAYIPTSDQTQAASRLLAERLLQGVSKATGQPILRIEPRGLGVLRAAKRPAVLLEMGFATHPIEGPWLLQASTQQAMAASLARTIQQMVAGGGTKYVTRPVATTPARPAPAPRLP